MGFYNIVLEGQQAEDYKARKAREAEEDKHKHQRDFERSINTHRREIDSTDTERVYALGKSGNRYDSGKRKNYHNAEQPVVSRPVHYDDDKRDFVPDGDYETSVRGKDDVQVAASKEDIKRQKYATQAARRAVKPGLFPDNETKRQLDLARDAANRNMRRHPEKWNKSHHESGIFESVEFLNEDWDAVNRASEDVKRAQADLNRTKQNVMSSISARHAELNSLLSRVETKAKNDSEEERDDISKTLDDIHGMLDDLLKD